MGAVSSSSPLILRCILRRAPPSTPISSITPSFLKVFKQTASTSILTPPPLPNISRIILSTRSFSNNPTVDSVVSTGEDTETDILTETEIEDKPLTTTTENEQPVDARISSAHKELMSKLKTMSVKEKKELGSYANSLGKKLKSQQVGKSGVTDSVAIALVETLEANELLKLKIHNNCPGELDDVVSQLEEATGSVVVGRIGRTVIIYRPSLTKLKAEEKKKQAMKLFLKRRAAFKASYQGKMQSRGPSDRRREFRRS